MSPFRFAIRLGLAALAVCAGFSASAIELRRGVNFELWQHWTSRSAFVAADSLLRSSTFGTSACMRKASS